MPTYFISDLHLSPAVPHIAKGLSALLKNQAAKADALYILGDFFDAWIGDDEDNPAALQIINLLSQYTASGVPTFFMHGNRDFLVGERFTEATGMKLLEEGQVISLYGRDALLMHGDSLCTEDTEYMKFRAMVRNPAWQQQVLSLPLEQRRQMAAKLRSESQSMNAMKASDIMDVTQSKVVEEMAAKNVDLLIHGHTHRPAKHSLQVNNQDAQRIVLGDWGNAGWYLKADTDGSLNLVEFPLN